MKTTPVAESRFVCHGAGNLNRTTKCLLYVGKLTQFGLLSV